VFITGVSKVEGVSTIWASIKNTSS
jgi:hypothetical protein